MVKLTVRYDKGLKENVFMLRDDESYVSSTKTVLTVGQPTVSQQDDYMYSVDVSINVLREIGTSQVILYDGDYVLKTFDWDGTAISESFDFPMGTNHDLRAVFNGNKKCLMSQSRVESVFMEVTAYDTHINFIPSGETQPLDPEPDYYLIKRQCSFDFEIKNVNDTPVLDGILTLSYNDGVHSGIAEATVEQGFASVDLGADFDAIPSGRFNFTAVFDRSESGNRSVKELQINKFYEVGITGSSGYGSTYIAGEDYTLTGTMADFFGEPYTETETVSFYGFNGFSQEWDFLDSGEMVDGRFQTVLSNNEYETYGKYRFGTHEEYGFEELNPILTPTGAIVTDLYFTSLGTSQNIEDRFTVDVYGVYIDEEGQITNQYLSDIPVHVTGTGVDDTFVTNAQGRVTCSYTPQVIGSGSTLTISAGDTQSITHNMQYFVTDYVAPSWKGQDLPIEYMTKQALANGMKYTTGNLNFLPMLYFKIPDGYEAKKQKFSCTVVSASNQKFFVAVRTIDGGLIFNTNNPLSAGNNVECTYDPSTTVAVVKVNGTERLRVSISKPYQLAIINGQVAGNIVLNNIKHEVL